MNPLLGSLAAFMMLCLMLLIFLKPSELHNVFDCFVVSGSIAVLIRYRSAVWDALRARDTPRPEQTLVVSIGGMCFATGSLRLTRLVGYDLGLLGSWALSACFVILTAVMIWSIFLKVVAPPLRGSGTTLSPWIAFGGAVISGSLLYALIEILDAIM